MLFAGNIGRFQGLDFLIKAMDELRAHKHIRLLMMGDGVEKERLLNLTKRTDANVTFVGHQSVEVAKASMAKSSLGFVSLLPNLYKYAYPSKVMTYLEQGCPILVAVEHESCIASDIINGGAGRVVSVANIEAICSTVLTMSEDKKLIAELKKNALRLSARINNRDLILAKWSSLVSN
jgi:glycosyltransferase involved in cell wall biosynthesis